MGYSPEVLDHFHHPRHAGEVASATAVATAANPVCGDVLKIWACVRNGVIEAVGFKADGCVPAVACGSWLAAWLDGKRAPELPRLRAEEIEAALGGLPAASKHAAALAISALNELRSQFSAPHR